MSTFDADTFLSQETEDALETVFTPVPEGDYTAIIDDIGAREITTDQGTTVVLDVTYNILDDEIRVEMGMERLLVRQSIFLDLEDNGALQIGPNKNVRLGKLREAVGQNAPGLLWGYAMLKGAGPLKIKVGIKPDKEDPTIKYNRVDRTSPLSM